MTIRLKNDEQVDEALRSVGRGADGRRKERQLVTAFLDMAADYVTNRTTRGDAADYLNKAMSEFDMDEPQRSVISAAWAMAHAWALDFDDAEDPPYEGYDLAIDEFVKLARKHGRGSMAGYGRRSHR